MCISVVGTRNCTLEGKTAAETFAKDACDDENVIVSGLAFGIDIASHRGSLLSNSGGTVAVLPGGIDTVVPVAHTKTAVKILENGGLLISEYTPGTPAEKFRFVQRNRIVAALSPATVVIQAPPGSGAMITASMALDYNRELMFHKACFSKEGQLLTRSVIQNLKSDIKNAKTAENKLNNSPERYVKEGAPVISSYAEYKSCRESAPGNW